MCATRGRDDPAGNHLRGHRAAPHQLPRPDARGRLRSAGRRRIVISAYVRAAMAAFYVSMRLRFVTGFAYLSFLIFPVIVAAIGLFVLDHPGTSATQWTYGVLGGGLVGYWGVTYIDAGNGIQLERWNGTLEQVFAVPTPLWVIVLGKALGGLVW